MRLAFTFVLTCLPFEIVAPPAQAADSDGAPVPGLLGGKVQALAVDGVGAHWIGTSLGLYRVHVKFPNRVLRVSQLEAEPLAVIRTHEGLAVVDLDARGGAARVRSLEGPEGSSGPEPWFLGAGRVFVASPERRERFGIITGTRTPSNARAAVLLEAKIPRKGTGSRLQFLGRVSRLTGPTSTSPSLLIGLTSIEEKVESHHMEAWTEKDGREWRLEGVVAGTFHLPIIDVLGPVGGFLQPRWREGSRFNGIQAIAHIRHGVARDTIPMCSSGDPHDSVMEIVRAIQPREDHFDLLVRVAGATQEKQLVRCTSSDNGQTWAWNSIFVPGGLYNTDVMALEPTGEVAIVRLDPRGPSISVSWVPVQEGPVRQEAQALVPLSEELRPERLLAAVASEGKVGVWYLDPKSALLTQKTRLVRFLVLNGTDVPLAPSSTGIALGLDDDLLSFSAGYARDKGWFATARVVAKGGGMQSPRERLGHELPATRALRRSADGRVWTPPPGHRPRASRSLASKILPYGAGRLIHLEIVDNARSAKVVLHEL